MPFDLPAGAASSAAWAGWAKAWVNRDFQDKQLRVVQYSARFVGYSLLQGDSKSYNGTKFTALYKQLSLSRKAFRACLWSANQHAAWGHLKAWLKDPSDIASLVQAVQWAIFSVHIFWDNFVFMTNPQVKFIDQPNSRWFAIARVKQRMCDFRAVADLLGLSVAWTKYAAARRACAAERNQLPLKADEGVVTAAGLDQAPVGGVLSKAEAKQKEAWYSMVKLIADLATYYPQTRFALKTGPGPWYNDKYIGVAGVVAALLSMRSEWIKMK